MSLRVDADVLPADYPARPADSTLLPIISGPPGALSPLAERRLLVTIAQEAKPGDARSLAEDLAFENALAFAGHLAALDLEIMLAPVGEAFRPEDLRALSRQPGVTAWWGPPIARPQDDPATSAFDLEIAAESASADLVILHDPALAAARRDARPTVVMCDQSHLVDWRLRMGDEPAPDAVRAQTALERLGLHAADRVITPSRALASEIVAAHGLTLPPVVVPPVFRKPEPREKRAGDAAYVIAGAAQASACDLLRLDRAASQVCGQTLLFDTGPRDPGQTLSFEQLHRLAPMTGAAAEAMLLRAAAFYAPSRGLGFEALAWRAASVGCAMILPDCKAHREFWQGAAHFIDPDSDEALAAALRRMLEDEDFRRKTAAAGLRRARALSGGPAIANLHKVLAGAIGSAPLTAAL